MRTAPLSQQQQQQQGYRQEYEYQPQTKSTDKTYIAEQVNPDIQTVKCAGLEAQSCCMKAKSKLLWV